MTTTTPAEAIRTQAPSMLRAVPSRESEFLGNAIAFVLPTMMFVEVRMVGRLFLSEIVLLCLLPFLLMRRGNLVLERLPRKLLLLGLAWLLSQILTDAIRNTPFEDWSRGWSKIVFLLVNFAAIYVYLDRKETRFVLFAVGIAVGQILVYFFNPNVYADDFPWKFGYGTAITMLCALASQVRFLGRRLPPSPVLALLGVLNFYMGFRSLGLICLLTGWVLWLKHSSRVKLRTFKSSQVALFVVLSAIAAWGIANLYEYGARDGWLGDNEQKKYLAQSAGDLGILLGGRTQILGSGQAIYDSPLIGHGSWAKDPKYSDILTSALEQHDYEVQGESDTDLIPSHSYIMGAWVEAGVVGAIFWIWLFFLTARTLIRSQLPNSPLSVLTALTAFNLLWNIPFSPFGAEARLYTAYDLSLMIFVLTLPGVPLFNRRSRRENLARHDLV